MEDEVSEMENESLKAASAGDDDKVSIWEVVTLSNKDWKIPFLISMSVNIGQQLSGINAVSKTILVVILCCDGVVMDH